MKTMHHLLARSVPVLALFLAIAGSTQAAQTNYYYVTTNGPGPAPYSSWGTAASNILDAVTQAQADFGPTTNCIITVSNGVYVLTNQISITKNITLQSLSGKDLTILDANGSAGSPRRVLNITSAGVVVDGFTIRNGYSTPDGGGVYI